MVACRERCVGGPCSEFCFFSFSLAEKFKSAPPSIPLVPALRSSSEGEIALWVLYTLNRWDLQPFDSQALDSVRESGFGLRSLQLDYGRGRR
jgi:hypothetical protein